MSRYELSPAAEADLEEIRDYLLARAGRDVASRVVGKLRDAVRKVAETPGLGHLREDLAAEPLRFYRVYKYLIVYRPQTDPLAVVRVLHGARDVRHILGND